MTQSTFRLPKWIGPLAAVVGLGIALGFAANFPAVEGLGDKVRLPVFHGAMTWVNLMLFGVIAVLAVAYLVKRRTGFYNWLEAIRWTAIPLWVIGSALGLMSALRVWDFTGSKSSPLQVAMEDPRLSAQFWIMLAALAVLALGLFVEERHWMAVGDLGFVAIAALLLGRAILGPGRALHPDSPVMNSDEIALKLIFLGIAAGLIVSALGIAYTILRVRAGRGGSSDSMGRDAQAPCALATEEG